MLSLSPQSPKRVPTGIRSLDIVAFLLETMKKIHEISMADL